MVSLRALVAGLAVLLATGVGPAGSKTDWDRFVEPQLGTSPDFPYGIFSVEEGTVLAVYSRRNTGESPARYVRENFKVPRQTIDYKRVAPTYFAISAVHEGEIYYSRCNFARRSGGTIHCFDLRYPARDKRAWDPIVTRLSLSLRPLERE